MLFLVIWDKKKGVIVREAIDQVSGDKEGMATNADFLCFNHATMRAMTLTKWGIDFDQEDDLCDAHGLAKLLRALDTGNITVRHEMEVVHSLKNQKVKDPAGSRAKRSKTTAITV